MNFDAAQAQKSKLMATGEFRNGGSAKNSGIQKSLPIKLLSVPNMPSIIPVRSKTGRVLTPHKAVVSAQYQTRTVLTNSPWEFVSLWLQRRNKLGALVLWNQAQEFYQVSRELSLGSAPLLHYYSFMNAAKALLTARGIQFDPHHGVKGENMRGRSRAIRLSNEGVKIKQTGVLPALSACLGETEAAREHSLKDLLYNLPYVHRTYCLTYGKQADMFVPLTHCRFVVDRRSREAYLSAKVSEDFPLAGLSRRLPPTLSVDSAAGPRVLRSVASVTLSHLTRLTSTDLDSIAELNRQIRSDLQYINATQTLWYAKLNVGGSRRLARFPLTLTLAAMHRLSEICRYRPLELHAFLSSQENWLLSEFVNSAPGQFLDGIAAEMTGYQFLQPNVRPAT